MTFDRRQSLIEDALGWMMTFDGRWSFMEDKLSLNKYFNLSTPSKRKVDNGENKTKGGRRRGK